MATLLTTTIWFHAPDTTQKWKEMYLPALAAALRSIDWRILGNSTCPLVAVKTGTDTGYLPLRQRLSAEFVAGISFSSTCKNTIERIQQGLGEVTHPAKLAVDGPERAADTFMLAMDCHLIEGMVLSRDLKGDGSSGHWGYELCVPLLQPSTEEERDRLGSISASDMEAGSARLIGFLARALRKHLVGSAGSGSAPPGR